MGVIEDLILKGKIKKCNFDDGMYLKEFRVGEKDLQSAKESFDIGNYKWATIQAYYGVFHMVRAVVFKAGYREESHMALKQVFKELYIKTDLLSSSIYNCFENGMHLREMADYKETYSKEGAEKIIQAVQNSQNELKRIIE